MAMIPDINSDVLIGTKRRRLRPQTPAPWFRSVMQQEGAIEAGFWVEDGKHPLKVLAAYEDTIRGKLVHVSLSYDNKLPTWHDVKDVRAAFFPDTMDVMMVLPRKGFYVNVHKFTMHLWQSPGEWSMM